MPKLIQPSEKTILYLKGIERVKTFCDVNNIRIPEISRGDRNWRFSVCAYYRPQYGIRISLKDCAPSATESQVRNWNWWGSVTDREPGGVLCHELGHHVDLLMAVNHRGAYWSDYGEAVRKESGEKPITSYCPNSAEWFAEMFRLFVTNGVLLEKLRPKTFSILTRKFQPVSDHNWEVELGVEVPQRILLNLRKKL